MPSDTHVAGTSYTAVLQFSLNTGQPSGCAGSAKAGFQQPFWALLRQTLPKCNSDSPKTGACISDMGKLYLTERALASAAAVGTPVRHAGSARALQRLA